MTLGLLNSSVIPGGVQGGSFHTPVWSAPDKVGQEAPGLMFAPERELKMKAMPKQIKSSSTYR